MWKDIWNSPYHLLLAIHSCIYIYVYIYTYITYWCSLSVSREFQITVTAFNSSVQCRYSPCFYALVLNMNVFVKQQKTQRAVWVTITLTVHLPCLVFFSNNISRPTSWGTTCTVLMELYSWNMDHAKCVTFPCPISCLILLIFHYFPPPKSFTQGKVFGCDWHT